MPQNIACCDTVFKVLFFKHSLDVNLKKSYILFPLLVC